MTDKVRMKVTVTFEYDADVGNYEGRSPADMAGLDCMNFEDDHAALYDTLLGSENITINVEPINGND